MRSLTADEQLPQVPARARPGGEAPEINAGVEPWAVTERMLAAPDGGRDEVTASSRPLGCSPDCSPSGHLPVPMRKPPTGEPDAGDPPVRFGGRGNRLNRFSLPLSTINCFGRRPLPRPMGCGWTNSRSATAPTNEALDFRTHEPMASALQPDTPATRGESTAFTASQTLTIRALDGHWSRR